MASTITTWATRRRTARPICAGSRTMPTLHRDTGYMLSHLIENIREHLYSTTSRPFPMPDTAKIAVKVINDDGDDVLRVFEV